MVNHESSPDRTFEKNDPEMSYKSMQSVGSSGTFNVNSLTKIKLKEDSNSSISMVNPFNSLRNFIKRDLKEVVEKRRMAPKIYPKDDHREVKGRRSPETNILISLLKASLSSEKIRKGHKFDFDLKDEKKFDKEDQKPERPDKGVQGVDRTSSKEEAKLGKDDKPEVK